MVFRGSFAIIPTFAIIGIIAIVLTAAYILYKIIQYVFLGEFNEENWNRIFDKDHWHFKTDMAGFELVTMVPLVVGMIFIGIFPNFVVDTINSTSQVILQYLP
jgi:NADH:ubiquinone oxidoreductase subunit 4 (subunit M)